MDGVAPEGKGEPGGDPFLAGIYNSGPQAANVFQETFFLWDVCYYIAFMIRNWLENRQG